MAISEPISITPRPKQLEYRPAIDGLRAVAVLAVFFFHLDRSRLPGGFVGVDIFFVISGYLITSIILKDCDLGRFRFGRFYQRRIARLLVAFFAMSLATLIGAIFFYSGQDSASAGASLAAAAASVANFKFLFQGNYFVLSPDAQPYLHCWSLSVEEQFYLLFPAAFLLLYRAARPHITRVLAALWVMSLLLCIGLTYSNPSWAFYLLPTRAWELLTGGILATLHNKPAEERKPSGSSGYVQLLGLALIAVSLFVISESRFFPGYLATLPVLGAAFVLAGVHNPHAVVEHVLSWGPMVAIGRASYSLYLWHWPVFSLVDYHFYSSTPAVRLALKVVVTATATAICYFFLEQPARVFLNHPARRRFAFLALVLSLITLIPLGMAVRRADYVDADMRDVASGGRRFNSSGKNGSLLLMGDSHAAMYGRMAVELAREQDLRLTVLGVAAGDPLPQSSGPSSALWLGTLNIVQRDRPDTVVIACNWSLLGGDKRRRLELAVNALSPWVQRIVVLTQPPEVPVVANRESIRKGSRPPFFEDPKGVVIRSSMNDIVKSFRSGKVAIADVEASFHNPDGSIRFTDANGDLVYQDRNHLTDAGAGFVKGDLLRAMKSREESSQVK